MRDMIICIMLALFVIAAATLLYFSIGCQKIIVVTGSAETTVEDEVGVDNEIPLIRKRVK